MPVVWIGSNSSSTEYEEDSEDEDEGEMHHWISYGDEGGDEEGELVTGYGDGAGVVMVLREVKVGKGP